MLSGHFYHGHIRRIVSVFGTLFNNINVVRKDQTSKVIYSTRVPLAYGPKSKFLMRLDQQKDLVDDDKIAMKLPRMSFEITSMTYDATTKINRNNTVSAIDAITWNPLSHSRTHCHTLEPLISLSRHYRRRR